ncbi:MAG: hypothetical protein KF744_02265 [Taibaiella sp.]|nr:hypothetical protein [Taibaiella sp.]
MTRTILIYTKRLLVRTGVIALVLFPVFFYSCRKSEKERKAIQKLAGPFSWHGKYWCSFTGATGSNYTSSGEFRDTFGFEVVSDKTVMLLRNLKLGIDTSVFTVYHEDEQTLELSLTRMVAKASTAITPFNQFPDTLVYYKAKDSIRLYKGYNTDPRPNYLWLSAP